jgi:adenosylhomocysteine nucleosidase
MIERIAIICGVAEEANAFLPDQSGQTSRLVGFSVRELTFSDISIAITCCGVGKVNAATAATLLALNYDAQLLMIIGTAGKIGAVTGDCFLLHEAVQNDYGARRADGFTHYRGGSWPIGPANMAPFRALDFPQCPLPRARIATGDAFIECPDQARAMSDALGSALVDMETAAVAQVAERLGLHWAGIKATTDDANGASAEDFDANLARAARRAAVAAESLITALNKEMYQ